MTSKVFIFIIGAALGVGVGAAIFSAKKSAPAAPIAETVSTNATAARVTDLETELESVKARLKQSEQQNDQLASRLQVLNAKSNDTPPPAPVEPKKPAGLAALFGGDGTNGMSKAMSEMVKTAMAQQFEAKLAGMTAKLNLTPEQQAAIREIMEKQSTRGLDLAQKMLKGEMSEEDAKDQGKSGASEEQQIKALLTPEQSAAYDEFQTEEKNRNARLAANMELMQMQSMLQLNEEQQDKVFAVLADQAQAKNNSADPLDFRGQLDKKAEALRGVLTPDQYQRYQKYQEQQLKMIEAFMPKGANNANVHVTPVIGN
jgi:hypothetical protein